MSGLRLTMPLGFRDANAQVREGQLSLARSYYQLRDTELKVLEYVVQQYRQVVQTHADIAPARAERKALQEYIRKIETLISIGKWNPQDFLNSLTVQQQLATAIATEFQAIANYNNALATFEFAKGTIKQYNNVSVNEGPLPAWAQKKAADHFEERAKAFKLRERDVSGVTPPKPGEVGALPVGPAVGVGFVDGLPPFVDQKWNPIPDAPKLPDPKDVKPAPYPMPQAAPQQMPQYGVGAGIQPVPAPSVSSGQPQQVQILPLPVSAMPQQPQVPQQPVVGGSTSTGFEPNFRPAGTVGYPSRGTGGGGGYVPPSTGTGASVVPSTTTPAPAPTPNTPAAPTSAVPQLPVGTGMAPLSIPAVGRANPAALSKLGDCGNTSDFQRYGSRSNSDNRHAADRGTGNSQHGSSDARVHSNSTVNTCCFEHGRIWSSGKRCTPGFAEPDDKLRRELREASCQENRGDRDAPVLTGSVSATSNNRPSCCFTS